MDRKRAVTPDMRAESPDIRVEISPKKPKRPRYSVERKQAVFTDADKIEIVNYYRECKSLKQTADKFSTPIRAVGRQSIFRWSKQVEVGQSLADKRHEATGRPHLICTAMEDLILKLYQAHRMKSHAVTLRMFVNLGKFTLSRFQSMHSKCCKSFDNYTIAQARTLLRRHRIKQRRATTNRAKLTPATAAEFRSKLLEEIALVSVENEIPHKCMVVNVDETSQKFISDRSTTLATKGEKSVPVKTSNDKRNITVVIGGCATGDVLPMQLIFDGKTTRCHPTAPIPEEHHVTHNASHWATAITFIDYLRRILASFFDCMRNKYGIRNDCPGIIVMDGFAAHLTDKIYEVMDELNIIPVVLPPNTTHLFQPMDLSTIYAFKSAVRTAQEDFIVEQLRTNLKVDFSQMSVEELTKYVGDVPPGFKDLKNQAISWFLKAWQHVKQSPKHVTNGFHKSGIMEAIEDSIQTPL